MCAVESKRYRITVRGRLTDRFASAFEGMTLRPGPGETVLIGEVADQAQLRGIIDCLWDFGLELLSVNEVPPCRDGRWSR
jgi:hypothetical protein